MSSGVRLYLTVWGAVMGVAAIRYRRLGPSMVAHSIANLVAVVALISSS